MLLRKQIECILRAILYPKTDIILICKDDKESKSCMDSFKKIIDKIQQEIMDIEEMNNGNIISLKNGSYIKIIESKNKSNEHIRGKRYNNFEHILRCSSVVFDEEFENVIKSYMKNEME